MGILRRGRNCYACRGDFGIKRCSCGRSYCPAHGFGGRCYVCQESSIGTLVGPMEHAGMRRKMTAPGPADAPQRKGALLPSTIRAAFRYDLADAGPVRENLLLEFKRYRPVWFVIVGVRTNHEIACYYHVRNVVSRVTVERNGLKLTTDLRGAEDELKDEGFAYLVRFLHMEILFLCEVVARSVGATVTDLSNDIRMVTVLPRLLGTCPWCGTACRGLDECPTCGRKMPNEMDCRAFLGMHARRQFMDKLVTVRNARVEARARNLLTSAIEARLRVLGEIGSGSP